MFPHFMGQIMNTLRKNWKVYNFTTVLGEKNILILKTENGSSGICDRLPYHCPLDPHTCSGMTESVLTSYIDGKGS